MSRVSVLPVTLAALLLLAGCTGEGPAPHRESLGTFPSGILFREPSGGFEGILRTPESALAGWQLPVGGFDVRDDLLVVADEDGLLLLRPDGSQQRRPVPGIHHLARPSLSPDGTRVVVQANEDPGALDDLNVYAVDLSDGAHRLLGGLPVNEESPEWSLRGDLVAYSSFDPAAGIDLHLVDPATGEERLVIPDAGAIHLAFSPDGVRILDPGRLRVWDTRSGELLLDLHDAALGGLQAEGFSPDRRYEGQAGRGTFPLDGAFSPDGGAIVFDGAVERDGAFGIVLATMALDGTDLRILAGPFAADPSLTNGHNFSETNPVWR